jgi:hypothetical protein
VGVALCFICGRCTMHHVWAAHCASYVGVALCFMCGRRTVHHMWALHCASYVGFALCFICGRYTKLQRDLTPSITAPWLTMPHQGTVSPQILATAITYITRHMLPVVEGCQLIVTAHAQPNKHSLRGLPNTQRDALPGRNKYSWAFS